MPEAYWNEGPEFKKREVLAFDRSKPPLADMPCVFGPDNSPPPAPPIPSFVVEKFGVPPS